MIYTIDVKANVSEKFLWLLEHFENEVKILSEEDDTLFSQNELAQRKVALSDLKAGKTVSEDDFAKEFFSEL
jgi:hypothetical protein